MAARRLERDICSFRLKSCKEIRGVLGQCHLVKALPYWLLFRQGYCNVYLCLIFLLKGDLSVFMQHKKTDCHLSEKKVYLILRVRLHDTENLPLT